MTQTLTRPNKTLGSNSKKLKKDIIWQNPHHKYPNCSHPSANNRFRRQAARTVRICVAACCWTNMLIIRRNPWRFIMAGNIIEPNIIHMSQWEKHLQMEASIFPSVLSDNFDTCFILWSTCPLKITDFPRSVIFWSQCSLCTSLCSIFINAMHTAKENTSRRKVCLQMWRDDLNL